METRAQRRRSVRTWLMLVVAAVVVLVGIVAVLAVREASRDIPQFPSLADEPDPSLQGTVAYLDGATGCVRIVAAAGQPSKEVLCLPPMDPSEAEALGKPIGPQLVWRGDGLLEVTMFRMTEPPGRTFAPGWQKIVDVRTGAVTDTPAAEVPSTPDLSARQMVSPSGERISFTSNRQTGHVTVSLTDASGHSRTLLDERGPGSYGYGLDAAFWSPDFRWVVADDGRILVIDPSDPPIVRVLTEQADSGFGGDQARFAVTSENLLAEAR